MWKTTGLSGGAIAGISIAGVVLLILAIYLYIHFQRRKKLKKASLLSSPPEGISVLNSHGICNYFLSVFLIYEAEIIKRFCFLQSITFTVCVRLSLIWNHKWFNQFGRWDKENLLCLETCAISFGWIRTTISLIW